MKKLLLIMSLALIVSTAIAQQDNSTGAPPPGNPNSNPNATPQQQKPRRTTASGPHARINLYGAYVFDDSFDYYYSSYDYYYGTLEGGFRGGAGLEYVIRPNMGIEVQWLHQDTNAPTYFQRDVGLAVDYDNFVVGLDYITLAFNKYVSNSSGMVEGYASLLAGMAIVGIDSPSRNASGSVSKFAWGMRLGANIWATPRIGLKLQADLMSIVDGVGGGLYFGTGGVGAGVTTYSTFYQFGLGGGLTFRLGQ